MKTTLRHFGQSAAVIAAALAAVLAARAVVAIAQAQPETQPAATQPASDAGPVVPRLQPVVLPLDEPAATSDDDRAAELARRLLADPLDAAVRNALGELRARLLLRDADALDALAGGLRMYLDIGPQLAAGALEKAAGNSSALSLTRYLPRPLEKIAAESRPRPRRPAKRPARAQSAATRTWRPARDFAATARATCRARSAAARA